MRLSKPPSMSVTQGGGADMQSYGLGENMATTVAPAVAAAEVSSEGTHDQRLSGEAEAATAMAADMQDIDKRLANLQNFLLATKTPTSAA